MQFCSLKSLLPLVLFATLLGCASQPEIAAPQTPQELYLRGVFTWWEADENFKLQQVDDDLYKAEAELIADGQPYDFRFADSQWSSGANCGYLNKAQDEVVGLGKRVSATCHAVNNNFKFTPRETGVYEFFIDFSQPERPQVYIERKG
ncbi:early set domain-containing protein [Bowmanella dokdonensis]|uniref:Pullulanase n=1 Tax=Bowmanella dokdonensis TaxID=751969 RepID=A0A939DNG5_9ALTE|nr:hypothetical protein [Bowmanella dokdonensis]MBN7825877.1 hypothetical protein [Bowmanella dokdonensis]